MLAQRVNMGVVYGDLMVNNHELPISFQRQTGYAQQQDLHLEQTTVREALQFSALLRQPASVPKEEKLAYAEEIIHLLEMESYAEAVVGEPGAGLGVEQRKKLTIGVELAAKPSLLLFLDEPTSGLDSQSKCTHYSSFRRGSQLTTFSRRMGHRAASAQVGSAGHVTLGDHPPTFWRALQPVRPLDPPPKGW